MSINKNPFTMGIGEMEREREKKIVVERVVYIFTLTDEI